MKKNLALYILLIFLIVVNGFFLMNYLGKPVHKKTKGKQENFIVRELKFDDTQKQKFEALEIEHHRRMRQILDGEKEVKDELFSRFSDDTINESVVDSLTNQLGKITKNKELELFHHFNAIHGLCNDNQREQFSRLLKGALHRNSNGAPPPDRRREGNRPPPPRGNDGHEPPPRHN
ncbi:Spy/CpxP family protein refolding chaperone [Psychroserpens sp.]|uniref:Spy/CpxP family protein refolding chaperone n=1 Tax=Psychroserpens sp. TaxID=2020870 RepID=UPI00385E19B5